MDSSRPNRQAIMSLRKPYYEGSVLMDVPDHSSLEELAEIAREQDDWQMIALATGISAGSPTARKLSPKKPQHDWREFGSEWGHQPTGLSNSFPSAE